MGEESFLLISFDFLGICFLKATCEDPGIPENGNRKGIGNFMDGDTIEFSCSRNYSLFGSSISRCLKGRWSSALPQCKGILLCCLSFVQNKRR